MPSNLELLDDMDSFDGLETVTFWGPVWGAEVEPATVAGALRRGLSRHEAEASGGRYVAGDARFHLPSASLGALAVAPGWRIVDAAGESWTILEVQAAALGSRVVCVARNLALVGGLDERITVQRAGWERDAHGAPLAVWSDWRTGVRARVQPVDAEIGINHDARAARRRYRIFLAEGLPGDGDLRIVRGEERYRVTGYERPERIGQLLVVLAERE